MLLII
jgi:hypothetical protein